MLRNTVVDLYGVDLINYIDIFRDVSVEVLNDSHDLDLIDEEQLNINNEHVRRSLTHNNLSYITDYVLQHHDAVARPIFLYNVVDIKNVELFNYIDPDRLLLYIERFAKKLNRLIGVSLVNIPCSYETFVDHVESRDGDAVDMLYGILRKSRPCSLYELHKFVQEQGLTSLQDKFFNSQHFKKILI